MLTQSKDAALLTAIFDAAVDAIIISDRDGNATRANEAACKLFGYAESEMIGRNVSMLMPEGLARRHDSFINNHIETGEKRIIDIGRDVEGQRKDGSVFPLHLSVGRATVDGELVFIGIMHDLSARRATEEALSRSQRLDAIGQMTGGIAHDFNNLLTVVIGNLELLEMRIDDDKPRTLIQDALEAAELGADLTSRLMVFARNSMLNPETCNLNDACEKSLSILKRTLGAKYAIKTKFHEDLPMVLIDPTQLQTSIMNLALNARDAMKDGGKLVFETEKVVIDDSYVAQEIDFDTGSYVRLTISDSGEGMSRETQRRAFEPFYSTKENGKGTGLGLSMVYGFVRQSGGHVTLYSELGHGTSFSLYFPAIDEAELDAVTGTSKRGDELPNFAGHLVLVVEDNARVRKLSVERLHDLGFKTIEAETADEAYAMLKTEPDVVGLFSDIVMPGTMSGYELANLVRVEFPKVKILLTSGYSEDVVFQAHDDDSAFQMIRKPFRQAELAHRLQALFSDV
ncbi:PAS domain S-box protein [Yoonia maritima]|uniref:PAS domain S-box protein n=1 Tax=Yoonia maritima TaxID=1435347 RepID=UPI003736DFD8